ncbi:GW dipeptide domain-containing protein [Lacticaseibacillus sp. 866-1]|uniref:GW dipeptide domain-containing protein n=1 Tax=Lacticaseibacillus sp. 866-1 TaxID=2799576 RepID=UPI001943DC2F|nr:GW dipeptide domain-containing protein [Lacticaseibacillus sp. 866-1]
MKTKSKLRKVKSIFSRSLFVAGIAISPTVLANMIPVKAATNQDADISITTQSANPSETNNHSNFVSSLNPQGTDSPNFQSTPNQLDESGSTAEKHVIRMPPSLPSSLTTVWTKYAKQVAEADYAKAGRAQQIIQYAATPAVETITIGNPLYPRTDTVDVASYQSWMTQANYNSLKKAGVKTIIVKLTEGSTYKSDAAATQIEYARNAGLQVAVYHYAHFATAGTAQAEAQYFANVIKSLGLPSSTAVVADLEDKDIGGNVATNLSQFWQTLNNNGYTNHILYTGKYYSWSTAAISTVGKAKTWLAQYPYSPRATDLWNTDYGAWQYSSTALVPGTSNRVDASIDYKGIFSGATSAPVYDSKVLRNVSYSATINQANRSDGLFSNGPYYTSADTMTPNAFAASFNGQRVTIDQMAITPRATWFHIQLGNGASYWIDRNGVSLNYDAITSTKAVNYQAQITQNSRNDGLFSSGPFFSSASTEEAVASAISFNGTVGSVTKEATTPRATWVQITLPNGKTYWLDKAGISVKSYDTIISRQTANSVAKVAHVTAADGLFIGGPYRTSAQSMKVVASAQSLLGQSVTVIAKAKTVLATWAEIRTNDGKTYWLDEKVLASAGFDKILSSSSVSQNAIIANAGPSDGLFSGGPYSTSAQTMTPSAGALQYTNAKVQVIGLATTSKATWAKIKMNNGQVFWVDNRVLNYVYDSITNEQAANETATIANANASDGLFVDGPYYTSSSTLTPAHGALNYQGQTVKVTETATTVKANWAKITLQNGQSFWVDQRVLSTGCDAISNQTTVNKTAKITSAGPADGLFASGPYNTSVATVSPQAGALNYNGSIVQVLATAKTVKANWAKVKLPNGKLYWVDETVLTYTYDSIENTKSATGTKTIKNAGRADGFFVGGPFYTSSSTTTPVAGALQYAGQQVQVLATAETIKATWAEIKLPNGKVYWVDNRVLG